MAVGGDITELRVNHPTLGSLVFEVKANEGNTYDPGGNRTNDDANAIATNGKLIRSITKVRAELNVMVANDQNTVNTADFLAKLSGSPVESEWTFTVINGTIWKLTGSPVGDIKPDVMMATVSIKIAGSTCIKIG